MSSPNQETIISIMLAAPDTPAAVDWYRKALGAHVLWSLGSVAGLEIDGAPFFLHEPVKNGFDSPRAIGVTTARVADTNEFLSFTDSDAPALASRAYRVTEE